MSKLLEKVMYNRTLQFIDKHQLLFISQYGFRKKHSCSDAIMELTREILKKKENSLYTACVFLDLSKAFDTLKARNPTEQNEQLWYQRTSQPMVFELPE